MAASTQEVLRIRRTDLASEQHFLVNVCRSGSQPLDLELVGTDRESIFPGGIKHASVQSLQAVNFSGDLEEWKSILSYALLHQRPEGALPESLQGVETVAAVSETTVTITLRRNVGGILQRLGAIKLEKDEEREVDLFDWIDAAAKSSEDLRSQLNSLSDSVISQKDQISRLTANLDNLVRAKKEHDAEMLSKFAALLNAKKLKIRDQQRLLAGAQIDTDAAEVALKEPLSAVRPTGRNAGSSRPKKRPANDLPEPAQEHENLHDQDRGESDAGSADDEIEDRRQQLTPETETEDEGEDEVDGGANKNVVAVTQKSSQKARQLATRLSRPASDQMDVDNAAPSRASKGATSREGKPANGPAPPPTSTANNDDDDETDDEL